jgi:O-acetyl-ADP-ribose deacetylase (regulator of RNase III)
MNTILSLTLRPYAEQLPEWPPSGRHIMAQFDADSIIVYQAYRPAIARYAVENQCFGGEFSYNRMSWIKPNFLWMMFRSGWAAKEGQEHVLAIRLKRPFFDELLTTAVASTFNASGMDDYDAWQNAISGSAVRLQWDPDHDPKGNSVERRAVQLGLRGEMLRRFGEEDLLSIEDITSFVAEQHTVLLKAPSDLVVPVEQVYLPADPRAAANVGIESARIPAIQYTTGDATRPDTSGPAVIAHVCNDIGGWGRGFVLGISARWREPEQAYRGWARGGENHFAPGEVQFITVAPGLWVANMIAQHDTKPLGGVPPIRYEALRLALGKLAEFCASRQASVHMPRIGCGLAGGEWSAVSTIINDELIQRGIPVTVYDLSSQWK